MKPDFSDSNNNSIFVNKNNQIDMKNKMKDIFGDKSTLQKSKTRQENMNKVFGEISKNNNKPTNNNKVKTPMFGKTTNINNNNINSSQNLGNSTGSLGSSGSSNLPNKDDVYTAKDEQAAPGVIKNP